MKPRTRLDGAPSLVLALAALAAGCAPCPEFAEPVEAGVVTLPEIVEASGLAASRRHADVIWTHNDSGQARLYALASDASWRATFDLVGAGIFDWEDMAAGPGPDPERSYLYVGDIGDNSVVRSSVTVLRVAEPELPATPQLVSLTGVESAELVYPDGPHNAETLLVDPASGDLYIVTKPVGTETVALVFRAAAPLDLAAPNLMEEVAVLDFDSPSLPGSVRTTGGDIDPSGEIIAIRTYTHLFAFCREPGQSLVDAFGAEPCDLPVAFEPQGEAVAFAADGRATFTLSEFASPRLHRSDRLD